MIKFITNVTLKTLKTQRIFSHKIQCIEGSVMMPWCNVDVPREYGVQSRSIEHCAIALSPGYDFSILFLMYINYRKKHFRQIINFSC